MRPAKPAPSPSSPSSPLRAFVPSCETSPDPEDIRVSPEVAFRRSDSHTWRGQPLHAYSFRRRTTAEEMGLKFGTLAETEIRRVEVSIGDGQTYAIPTYSGLVFDVALVLWLCNQDDATIKAIRRNPAQYEDALDEWADEHNIALTAPTFAEDYLLFMQILADVSASQVAVAPSTETAAEGPKS